MSTDYKTQILDVERAMAEVWPSLRLRLGVEPDKTTPSTESAEAVLEAAESSLEAIAQQVKDDGSVGDDDDDMAPDDSEVGLLR